MNSEFEQELVRLTDSIKEVGGVIYIAMYGSYARGDYDRGSDIDILILFQDKESMEMNREEVFRRAANFKMFFQLAVFTLEEFFNNCNPIFVRSVIRDGKILFQKEPERIEHYLGSFMQRHPELILKGG